MANILISPNKYIQGNENLLKSSFEDSDCEVIFEIFNGECSKNEVNFFCKEVALPKTLKQLGIKDKSKENIMKVSVASTAPNETIHNMPFKVTAEDVYSAILSSDSLGNLYN